MDKVRELRTTSSEQVKDTAATSLEEEQKLSEGNLELFICCFSFQAETGTQ